MLKSTTSPGREPLGVILEMNTSTNHTADSIILNVVSESLNWADCHKTTFDLLLANIILHDSRLQLISLTDPQEAVLLVNLDLHWNKSYCEVEDITQWPYFIIRLSHVVSVWTNATSYRAPIGDVKSEKFDDRSLQKLRLFASDNKLPIGDTTKQVALCKTVITDAYGGKRAFIHDETIELLFINAEGKYLNGDLSKLSR